MSFLTNYTVTSTGCWEYNGNRDVYGYGRLDRGKAGVVKAHRAYYEHYVGPIPEGLFVRHLCANPSCVNPDHLRTGSHSDNMRDMVRQGRSLKGAANPQSKLSAECVMEAVGRHRAGESYSQIARRFGVHKTCIALIMQGRSWSHLTGIEKRGAA